MKKFTSLTAILLCTVWMAHGQWTYTNLSEAKFFMGSATVGNKVYFAGGTNNMEYLSDVEVYDLSTGAWAPAGNLFVPRFFVGGSVSCGSKIFFAGGYDDAITYNFVDIYDTELQEWSVELLSVDRFSLAAVSHGDTVMFAGGIQIQGSPSFKNTIDIYNIETGQWATPATLSQARGGIAAAVVGNLAIFAGGWINTSGTTSNCVDIYNFTNKTWSQAILSQARAYASAVTVGTKVIIAGGITSINNPTTRVDIYDAETGLWTQASLSVPRSFSDNGAAVAGKAYFAGGGTFFGSGFNNPSNVIDVYDPETNTWTVMNLLAPRVDHSVLGVGNCLVVAGGKNDSGLLSSVEIFNAVPTSCLPEGITFETQEEIDNFQANYPGCTEIEGDVTIGGYYISNLNGLNVLTSIGGTLQIGTYEPGNQLLTSLTGLENLIFVGGDLLIGGNGLLGGSLNPNLTSLSGLESLTSIGGFLSIVHNDALTSFSGLESLTSIGGFLSIVYNEALTSFSGLESLTSIGGILKIWENYALFSLSGLESLTSIGGDLEIVGNYALTSLSGLESLTSIGGYLSICLNYALTSLSGLENIQANSIDYYLAITGNDVLYECDVQSICDYIAIPGAYVNINDNAPGCNSPEEVEEACLISVEETDVENQISLFPNPADKTISIGVKGGMEIEEVSISNHLGQVVLKEKPVNNFLDVSALQPGVYFLNIISGQSKIIRKLVIQ